jgi:hypothetical protein
MRECESPLLREVRNSLTRVQQRPHGICERLPFPFPQGKVSLAGESGIATFRNSDNDAV